MRLSDWAARVDIREEIQEVYAHRFLNQLGKKLVTIFIPLYLLDSGFSNLGVLLFFSIYLGLPILLSLPSAKIASYLGYKKTCLASSPLILGYYYLLRGVSPGSVTPYLIAAVGGIGFNLYWVSMNSEVAESSYSSKRTEESGYFNSMSSAAAAISPFLGGLLLAVFNFNTLFLIAMVLVFISFLPFVYNSEHRDGMDFDIKDYIENYSSADFGTYFLMGGISLGSMIVWPFYLAKVITGSVSIGGAGTLLAVGGMVTSISVGKLTRKLGKQRVIAIGAAITALTYLIMSQVTSPTEAIAISGLNGLSFTVFKIPIFSAAMDHSEKSDKLEYFAVREIGLSLGRLTFLGFFLLAFLRLPVETAFLTSFSILAGLALALPLVDRRMIEE